MPTRPGERAADLPLIADLLARYETAWFGAPEQDLAEVTETMDRVDDWAADVRVAEDDTGRVIAAAWRWQQDLDLILDPTAPGPEPLVGELLAWLAAGPVGQLQVLDRDDRLGAEVVRAGWRHERSAFELVRAVTDAWTPAAPRWPSDVVLREYRPADAAAVHRLVYVDAGWGEVVGHHDRDLGEWQSLFLAERTSPLPPVIAWRAEHPVGAALCRTFSDGTGWINQLAVARDARGSGLGRALLLAALRRLLAARATRLALGVQADNRAALRLYLDAGLQVEREYCYFGRPRD